MRCFFIEAYPFRNWLGYPSSKRTIDCKDNQNNDDINIGFDSPPILHFLQKIIISHNIDFDAKVKTLFSMQKIVRWSFIKKIESVWKGLG